jgi:hypothetical protein
MLATDNLLMTILEETLPRLVDADDFILANLIMANSEMRIARQFVKASLCNGSLLVSSATMGVYKEEKRREKTPSPLRN